LPASLSPRLVSSHISTSNSIVTNSYRLEQRCCAHCLGLAPNPLSLKRMKVIRRMLVLLTLVHLVATRLHLEEAVLANPAVDRIEDLTCCPSILSQNVRGLNFVVLMLWYCWWVQSQCRDRLLLTEHFFYLSCVILILAMQFDQK